MSFDLLHALTTQRLLAIVRGHDVDASVQTILTLADAGVGLIEVSLSSSEALTVLSRACDQIDGRAAIGAGTVRTADDAHRASEAGASFLVTPTLGAGFTEAVRMQVPVLAGALTPTEIDAAVSGGATAVKLFPASLGGPRYLRAVRAPLPDVPLVPVGGVDANAAHEYLAAGAIAVGVGSPLIGDATDGGSLTALHDRARAFIEAVGNPKVAVG